MMHAWQRFLTMSSKQAHKDDFNDTSQTITKFQLVFPLLLIKIGKAFRQGKEKQT